MGIIINETLEVSFLSKKITEKAPINIDDPNFSFRALKKGYESQEKNRIIFDAPEMAVEFLIRWIFLETNIIRFALGS